MKRLLLSLLFLPTLAFGQANPPGNGATWTISDPTGITRFEMSFDAGAFSPTIPPLPTPVSGVYKTTFPASLTLTVHTVSLRACNVAGCGPASVAAGFTFAGFAPTVTPANVTIILQ